MNSKECKTSLLVLAAGLGSRFGGDKQINGVGPNGEFLLEYSIYDALHAGFDQIVLVVNKEVEQPLRERIEPIVGKDRLSTVIQPLPDPDQRKKPWGTGHAVLSAKSVINGPFMVINGDDFYGREAFELANELLRGGEISSVQMAMIGYQLKRTLSANGPVSRGVCSLDEDGFLLNVSEFTGIERPLSGQISSKETDDFLSDDTTVSMNCWLFDVSFFDWLEVEFAQFLKENRDNATAEFYLPSAVQAALTKEKFRVPVMVTNARWCGLTYASDREEVQKNLCAFIDQGFYPKHLRYG
jgi:UTP-glucose-1-phosphate uridylyltransferase